MVLFSGKWNAPTGWRKFWRVSYSLKGKCVASCSSSLSSFALQQAVSINLPGWQHFSEALYPTAHPGPGARRGSMPAAAQAMAGAAGLLPSLTEPQDLPKCLSMAHADFPAISSPLGAAGLLDPPTSSCWARSNQVGKGAHAPFKGADPEHWQYQSIWTNTVPPCDFPASFDDIKS